MDLCGLPHTALGSGANVRFRPPLASRTVGFCEILGEYGLLARPLLDLVRLDQASEPGAELLCCQKVLSGRAPGELVRIREVPLHRLEKALQVAQRAATPTVATEPSRFPVPYVFLRRHLEHLGHRWK